MPQLSSNNIPRNTRNTRPTQPVYAAPVRAGVTPLQMPDSMRHALMKVGVVAVLCIAALFAFQSPSPQPRTHSATVQPTETPRRAEIVPAVLRTTTMEDSREVERRREEIAREYTRREEARRSQAAAERAEEARQATRQAEAERERVAQAERAAESERITVALRLAEERESGAHQPVQQLAFTRSNTSLMPPVPQVAQQTWIRFRLIPGLNLNINTHGRPCTVRTDVTMGIFANHPSLPHRTVPAGDGLRFPLNRGQGPNSIHARPAGRNGGTLELRFDD